MANVNEAGTPDRPQRVSEAERDAIVELLKERTVDGSLTLDEFAERVGRALAARTRPELDDVVGDLRGQASVPDVQRARSPRHHVISFMGSAETKGRWRCGNEVTSVAFMGGCHIDFRRAEITASEVHVTAVAFMGGIDIVVPEGIEVTMDGFPFMGGRNMQIKDVPPLPGSPHIVVHAFPIMGGVVVRSKPPKDRPALTRPDPAPPAVERKASPAAADFPLDGTVTIMFSDVCDYTGITERLGDKGAHELLREHNEIVRTHINAYGGREVKSNGDGFMVAFNSAARAVRCAIALQQSLADRNAITAGEEIRVHIGIHAGDVVHDGDDFVGGAVIIASRLADAAGPDQILVSSVARELAGGSREFAFDPAQSVLLKGMSEARDAYPVHWRAESAVAFPREPQEGNPKAV